VDEECLGRPQADAGDGGQAGQHLVVGDRVEVLDVPGAGELRVGQGDGMAGPGRGQATSVQPARTPASTGSRRANSA
jgi:hypothetical protein